MNNLPSPAASLRPPKYARPQSVSPSRQKTSTTSTTANTTNTSTATTTTTAADTYHHQLPEDNPYMNTPLNLTHLALMADTCQQLTSLLKSRADHYCNNSTAATTTTTTTPSSSSSSSLSSTSVIPLLMSLIQLNRLGATHQRDAKLATNDTKKLIADKYLLLQNINYERLHLEREIDQCLMTDTIYQDIDLCSIEEFHAMTKTTDTTTTTNDTIIDIDKQIVDDQSTHHQLMLARLKHELSERMRLAEAEKVLVGEKMALQRDLEVAMGVLDKLDADMDLFIKSSLPLQKQLGVDVLLQEQQSTQDEEDISMAVVVEEGEQVEEEKQQAGMNTKSSSFNVKAPVFVPAEPCSSVVDDDAMVVTEDG